MHGEPLDPGVHLFPGESFHTGGIIQHKNDTRYISHSALDWGVTDL